jgi:N-acetylmuramoyl-L-alanine amidase
MNRNLLNRCMAGFVSGILLCGGDAVMAQQGSSPVPTLIQSQLPPRSLLQAGSTGAEVQEIQGVLGLMGLYGGPIDGRFDTGTAAAVVRFQQMAGLQADGVVGSATWVKLLPPAPGEAPVAVVVPAPVAQSVAAVRSAAPAPMAEGDPVLRNKAIGPAVSRLQRRLQQLGFYKGAIDGGFGDETEMAVKAAQRHFGLTDDGIVGEGTWRAIR